MPTGPLFQSPGHWGHNHRTAPVSITFDNLGEAADLERGLWPQDKPLGQHPSVILVLPAILKMLAELDLPATFFVEGLNTELYPQALQNIVASGHEVAYHAWRHESWQNLSPTEEEHILTRGIQAMENLAMRPTGFRPPGGILTASSLNLLKTLGFTYCSPAGSGLALSDGLAILPFAWPLVDAYAYLPRFATLREQLHDSPEPLSSALYHARLRAALQNAVQNRSYLSLLFHPFIEEKPEYFAVMYALLEELRTLVHEGTLWCAPCRDVAHWMLHQPI